MRRRINFKPDLVLPDNGADALKMLRSLARKRNIHGFITFRRGDWDYPGREEIPIGAHITVIKVAEKNGQKSVPDERALVVVYPKRTIPWSAELEGIKV